MTRTRVRGLTADELRDQLAATHKSDDGQKGTPMKCKTCGHDICGPCWQGRVELLRATAERVREACATRLESSPFADAGDRHAAAVVRSTPIEVL